MNKKQGRPKKLDMRYFGVKLDDKTIQAIRVLSEDTGLPQGTIIKTAIESTFETNG